MDSGPLRPPCCDACGGTVFDGGDDGFYYCHQCGVQSQDVVETACADEDICGRVFGEGGLYNRLQYRSQSQRPLPKPKAPTKEEILRSLARNLASGGGGDDDGGVVKKEEEEKPFEFGDEVTGPLDFGSGPCPDAETLANGIRLRYVQGMQLMIQMQCKELVEGFGVSPLVCGIVAGLWLKYVAATRVFDEGWADRAILESEAAAVREANAGKEEQDMYMPIRAKYRSEPHNLYGQRAIYIWFRSLRKMIPLHSSLSVTFLACHIAREPILPTDIVKYALEGKLPYLSAFVDIEKALRYSSSFCPLSLRLLFKPAHIVGMWQLEATAGSVAQCIGLHLPPVNFYATAHRYLKELSLQLEKILPCACHIYEWSMPAELWLSANAFRLPTRICVMSILIVAIRILYNIHGQGTWEMTLSSLSYSSSSSRAHLNPDLGDPESASMFENRDCDIKEGIKINTLPNENSSQIQASEFNAAELLCRLEATYNIIADRLDYSKDLSSYLKYCKDVIFVGLTTSYEEEKLIERLWNIYEEKEDHDPIGEHTGLGDANSKRSRDEVRTSMFAGIKKSRDGQNNGFAGKETLKTQEHDKTFVDGEGRAVGSSVGSTGESSCLVYAKDATLRKMKAHMDENGFEYLPPRVRQRSDGYLHYKRKKVGGKLQFVAHADYYILLRICAKLAQVDIRIMHLGVLKFERRLGWTEQQISSSLVSLRHSYT